MRAIIIRQYPKGIVRGRILEEVDGGRYMATPRWSKSWLVCLDLNPRELSELPIKVYDKIMNFRDAMIKDSRAQSHQIHVDGKLSDAMMKVERFGDDFTVRVTSYKRKGLDAAGSSAMEWIRYQASSINADVRKAMR